MIYLFDVSLKKCYCTPNRESTWMGSAMQTLAREHIINFLSNVTPEMTTTFDFGLHKRNRLLLGYNNVSKKYSLLIKGAETEIDKKDYDMVVAGFEIEKRLSIQVYNYFLEFIL